MKLREYQSQCSKKSGWITYTSCHNIGHKGVHSSLWLSNPAKYSKYVTKLAEKYNLYESTHAKNI